MNPNPQTQQTPLLYRAIAFQAATLALAVLAAVSACSPTPTDSEASPTGNRNPTETEQTDESSTLLLKFGPFSDFYFEIRAQAGGAAPAQPQFAPIIQAWMPVQEEIGTFGGFWRFDLAGLLSESPAEFEAWFVNRAETIPSRSGGSIPIKAPGLAMADAMRDVWPAFLSNEWPSRRERLAKVLEELDSTFLPKHQEALRFMLDSLGIEDPKLRVPMILSLHAHHPGASTFRSSDGPIAVLAIEELLRNGEFSELAETVLHEAVHVLDLASEGTTDAFTVLRRMLNERGMTRRDPRFRGIPHLVMFAQAEHTMRSIYDPEHVAYGDTTRGEVAPLYQRHGEDAVVVRKHWAAYLNGETDRVEALQRIVDDLVSEPSSS